MIIFIFNRVLPVNLIKKCRMSGYILYIDELNPKTTIHFWPYGDIS